MTEKGAKSLAVIAHALDALSKSEQLYLLGFAQAIADLNESGGPDPGKQEEDTQ